jgi:hypothetical protein
MWTELTTKACGQGAKNRVVRWGASRGVSRASGRMHGLSKDVEQLLPEQRDGAGSEQAHDDGYQIILQARTQSMVNVG